MILKEYPTISNDGKEVASKTNELNLISDFVHQMAQRGNLAMVYYLNPEIQMMDEEEREEVNIDTDSGICWADGFDTDAIITMLLSYANLSFSPKQRKIFAKRIENAFLENEMYEEEEEYEDYEDFGDYDDEDDN